MKLRSHGHLFLAAMGGGACSIYNADLLDEGEGTDTAAMGTGGSGDQTTPPSPSGGGPDDSPAKEPECADNKLSEGETDVDCGGNKCNPCALGSTCLQDEDCKQPNAGTSATATCDGSVCSLSCSEGRLDCNGKFDDGCESDPLTDSSRCGGCLPTDASADAGVSCEARDNATTLCNEGVCSWKCASGWIDSDGDLPREMSNGCEQAILSCAAPFDGTIRYVVGAEVSRNEGNWECLIINCFHPDCAPGIGTCPWAMEAAGHAWGDLGLCSTEL